MFRFEKLDVWQKAIDFADSTYTLTRSFPDVERFGLTSQMRRAAVSISSNIAEGSGRMSDKEFCRFLDISYGSLMEVVSQSKVAENQNFLLSDSREQLYGQAETIPRMLSGLRSSIKSRD